MTPDDMIGATVGSYKVTAKLGQGGMGAVYLAEHPLLQRKAAVKVLLPELSSQKELVERFFHEARTTARLRHPAMVDVYDFGTLADGRAYLIMDFLDGECLEARIRDQGRLSVALALRIARDIALGVSVAHGEQIVHRDLKPDNIFLLPVLAGSADERVKILDFGIAKLGGKQGEEGVGVTRVGALMGTPLYMSPEQCRGAGEVDSRADIYSLGCILFAMLAGRPPFVSDSMGELLGMQLMAPPPTLESLGVTVPPAVESLVQSLLAKSPEHRPASMVDVADTMDRLLRVVASSQIRNAQTLALGSHDRDGNTRRGRPTPDQLRPGAVVTPNSAETDAGWEAAGHSQSDVPITGGNQMLGTGGGPTGTLAGRSISENSEIERTKFAERGRKSFIVAGTLLVVVAGGLLLLGVSRRSDDKLPVPVSAGATRARTTPAAPPPAESGSATRAAGTMNQPAVQPPAHEVPVLPPAPGTTQTPVPAHGEAVRDDVRDEAADDVRKSGPRRPTTAAERTRVVPSRGPLAQDPATTPVPPKAATATPNKGTRPVYRGTQLQIEKNDPYQE